MNSEVWDLRTLSLLHSCPALDGAAVTFAGADVLFAIQRPISDDLRACCPSAPLKLPACSSVLPVRPMLCVSSAAHIHILTVTSTVASPRHEQTWGLHVSFSMR